MKSIQPNNEVIDQITKAAEVAKFLWQREWAERNGGNLSLNLTECIGDLPSDMSDFVFVEQKGVAKEAADMSFFVTGTGKRMRDLSKPETSACLITFNNDASGYYIIWGGNNDPEFRPSCELLPHVKMHLEIIKSGSPYKAVLHTHPIELIALSHHPVIGRSEELFNRTVWSMLPEVRVYVPKGVGLAPYSAPSSEELADRTVEALKTKDVAIWSMHGAIAAGLDAEMAFDFIDVANKGAKIYLQCLSSGYVPAGMTDAQLDELADIFLK